MGAGELTLARQGALDHRFGHPSRQSEAGPPTFEAVEGIQRRS